MLRRRVLDALDSPMPLVFVEAVQGAGKRTLLTQWVHERPPQSTEIRMLFEAPQVPTAPLELLRLFWAALQRERTLHLPDLPSSGEQVREVARRHLREVRRPIEVAVIGGDHFTAEAFDAVLNLLDLDARLVIAGFDLSEHRRIARSRGIFFSDVTDRDVNFTLEETRELVREQGADLTETAVTSLFHATRGHAAAIRACLALLPAETVAALMSRRGGPRLHRTTAGPRVRAAALACGHAGAGLPLGGVGACGDGAQAGPGRVATAAGG